MSESSESTPDGQSRQEQLEREIIERDEKLNRVASTLGPLIKKGSTGDPELDLNLYLEQVKEDRLSLMAAAHEADYDPSGLFNKRAWRKIGETWVSEAEAGQREFGVIFVDLTRFKQINDKFGHEVGDTTIQQVAGVITALKDVVRTTDDTEPQDIATHMPFVSERMEASRYGGDEFALLVDLEPRNGGSNLTQEDRLKIVAGKLKNEADAMRLSKPELVKLGFDIAIGSAVWKPGMDLTALVKEADDQMYVDKQRQHSGKRLAKKSLFARGFKLFK